MLNNDIEVISPGWMSEMLGYCQREDVGIVGAKLYSIPTTPYSTREWSWVWAALQDMF